MCSSINHLGLYGESDLVFPSTELTRQLQEKDKEVKQKVEELSDTEDSEEGLRVFLFVSNLDLLDYNRFYM